MFSSSSSSKSTAPKSQNAAMVSSHWSMDFVQYNVPGRGGSTSAKGTEVNSGAVVMESVSVVLFTGFAGRLPLRPDGEPAGSVRRTPHPVRRNLLSVGATSWAAFRILTIASYDCIYRRNPVFPVEFGGIVVRGMGFVGRAVVAGRRGLVGFVGIVGRCFQNEVPGGPAARRRERAFLPVAEVGVHQPLQFLGGFLRTAVAAAVAALQLRGRDLAAARPNPLHQLPGLPLLFAVGQGQIGRAHV